MLLYPAISLDAQVNYTDQGKSKVRIGIYDSRVVAYAFTRSELFELEMKRLTDKLDSAKMAGDRVKIIGLEKNISKLQNIRINQVISTYPVIDIIDLINDSIPGIVEKYKVSAIVNKWAISYLNQDVDIVDITVEIARLFANENEIRRMYPPYGIPDPQPLMETEGIVSDTGIEEFYEGGPDCSVSAKDYKSEAFNQEINGKWKALQFVVRGRDILGHRTLNFYFHANGLIQLEEPGKYVAEGEWVTGLDENSILFIMNDKGNSLSGRYDFENENLIISGKGFVGQSDYVCLKLQRVKN
jgi:hypothetical protein